MIKMSNKEISSMMSVIAAKVKAERDAKTAAAAKAAEV